MTNVDRIEQCEGISEATTKLGDTAADLRSCAAERGGYGGFPP